MSRRVDNVDAGAAAGWIHEFARVIARDRQLLTDLDAAIGDADHGINIDRGMMAVRASLNESQPATVAGLFKTVGTTLVSTVGGASGPLYGTFFLRMAAAAGQSDVLDAPRFAKVLRAGLDGVVQRGKPEAGDKTMYDALAPAAEALEAAVVAGVGLGDALDQAADAAAAGRDATTAMAARKGRASYLGQRSVGHQDPGAASAALLIAAAATALAHVTG